MSFDPSTKQRLAELITEALELDSGKYEGDAADDLFRAFGLELKQLDAEIPQRTPNRKNVLRAAAAAALASAAPSMEALITAMVRCGGRFVAMVEEVYELLAANVATTTGSSEQFRIERAELDITISVAFIEELRVMQRAILSLSVGPIDASAIGGLVGWDGGVLYGTWPIGSGGFRLLDAVLNLGWLVDVDAGSTPTAQHALRGARAAADRLVATAERLLGDHMTHLAALEEKDVASAFTGLHEWSAPGALAELRRVRRAGVLAATAVGDYIAGLDETSSVGLSRGSPGAVELRAIALPPEDSEGTGASALAGFVAMRRLGMYAHRSRSELEQALAEASVMEGWLDSVRTACDEASAWLRDQALVRTGSINVDVLLARFTEYLNLPLWRGRQLLYEVWILCTTLRACEAAGWRAELRFLDQEADVWVLSTKPTTAPVADLRCARDRTIMLEVWREPSWATATHPVTPDVTISTPGEHPRHLVVIEAKDRFQMPAGGVGDRSAVGVAMKYRATLRPIVTWVCNHCDFREGDIDPSTNYGDVWSRVHLAAPFRPGTVPSEFAPSIAAALTPPGLAAPGNEDALLLAVDVTGSMLPHLQDAWAVLSGIDANRYRDFRAVLYSDHSSHDPFVVRDVGPCADLATLLRCIDAEPTGGGGDHAEALEDAMRRCAELATGLGPLTVVVLTDAPPHPPADCPLAIDFVAEVRALLATGSRCLVASDWQWPDDASWRPFVWLPGFNRAPLAEIGQRLAAPSK